MLPPPDKARILETPPQLSPRDFAAATLAEVMKTGRRRGTMNKRDTGGSMESMLYRVLAWFGKAIEATYLPWIRDDKHDGVGLR